MSERPLERAEEVRTDPSRNSNAEVDRPSENREEGRGRAGECTICSYKQVLSSDRGPVFHNHFSSIFLRKLTGVEHSSNDYLCPSCKRQHVPYPENKLNIVVSDSTLHQFFAPSGYTETLQYSGDTHHIDYLTIAGARISALLNAFRIEYVNNPPPMNMNVVLVAGYYDLAEGYARDYIIEKMYTFADLVTNSTVNPEGRNTVTIASLLYPPQLAWLPDNGPFPHEEYVNNKNKIDWLNQEIKKLNEKLGVRFPPCFHTYGVRTSTRKRVDRYGQVHLRSVKSQRWEHWRESEPQNMLHLSTERRFKMGEALNRYFRFNDPEALH